MPSTLTLGSHRNVGLDSDTLYFGYTWASFYCMGGGFGGWGNGAGYNISCRQTNLDHYFVSQQVRAK